MYKRQLLDVFADKRCTGMNFDRPEFERLLKALQERKIDCIVVKDFSRLGRNFVETGQYLEQVFPLFGVRFIAINDNYDSLNRQSRDGMLVPIKSMINEMYSKDPVSYTHLDVYKRQVPCDARKHQPCDCLYF